MKTCDFAGLVPACCSEVLDAMYFTTVLDSGFQETAAENSPDKEAPIAFSLHFAGDVSGHFGIQLELPTARKLAANFLGEEESSISWIEADEVAGELANMLCGSVMSRVEGEHKFVLSHPEAIASPPVLDPAKDFVCKLATDSGDITVWIATEEGLCRQ
jgi:CheY-specific phosphatase CheX